MAKGCQCSLMNEGQLVVQIVVEYVVACKGRVCFFFVDHLGDDLCFV